MRPSTVTTPLPSACAALKAATILPAIASSASDGAKTSLHGSTWLGWISVLPSKPISSPCRHTALKPSASWMSL